MLPNLDDFWNLDAAGRKEFHLNVNRIVTKLNDVQAQTKIWQILQEIPCRVLPGDRSPPDADPNLTIFLPQIVSTVIFETSVGRESFLPRARELGVMIY